jgi:hypothetical protein
MQRYKQRIIGDQQQIISFLSNYSIILILKNMKTYQKTTKQINFFHSFNFKIDISVKKYYKKWNYI